MLKDIISMACSGQTAECTISQLFYAIFFFSSIICTIITSLEIRDQNDIKQQYEKS